MPLESFDQTLKQFESMADFGGDTPIMTSTPPAETAPGKSTEDSTSSDGGLLGSLFSFSTRIVAIVLGLIFIAGAIYLYKGPDIIGSIKTGAAVAA